MYDYVTAGTCSVNECGLTDREVEGWDPDNSASGIDGTVVLYLDWTDKVKTPTQFKPVFQRICPAKGFFVSRRVKDVFPQPGSLMFKVINIKHLVSY